jgi:hypothetical protein
MFLLFLFLFVAHRTWRTFFVAPGLQIAVSQQSTQRDCRCSSWTSLWLSCGDTSRGTKCGTLFIFVHQVFFSERHWRSWLLLRNWMCARPLRKWMPPTVLTPASFMRTPSAGVRPPFGASRARSMNNEQPMDRYWTAFYLETRWDQKKEETITYNHYVTMSLCHIISLFGNVRRILTIIRSLLRLEVFVQFDFQAMPLSENEPHNCHIMTWWRHGKDMERWRRGK